MSDSFSTRHIAPLNQDRTDLENERMGLENTGRIKRFLVDAFGTSADAGKKRRERDMDRASLQAMLLNKAYAERYNAVIEKLSKVEQSVEIALARIDAALRALEAREATLIAGAVRDLDDRLIFVGDDGETAVYADGTIVDSTVATEIIWPEGATTHKDWRENQQGIADAESAVGELEHIRDNVLAPIRVEMQDEDNPPTQERLEQIEEKVDASIHRVGELSSNADAPEQRIVSSTGPQNFATPNIDALLPG